MDKNKTTKILTKNLISPDHIRLHHVLPMIHFYSIIETMLPMPVQKRNLDLRSPQCGGRLIHGTEDCYKEDGNGNILTSCCCPVKPTNFNYAAHYSLAQAICLKNQNLSKNCEQWSTLALQIFSTGSFRVNL